MSRLPISIKKGDEVRVIAPSYRLDEKKRSSIVAGFGKIGLQVSFSDHCFEHEATKQDKIDDLHNAFLDPKIRAVFAATGGFSSNQLLPDIDYKLIKSHPKVFVGYSDITVLLNAINAKTGLITYHGTNANGVGSDHGQIYTHSYLEKCLFTREVFSIEASDEWFNKDYSGKHPKYSVFENTGWWSLNRKGIVEGRLVGGNLSCLSLLAGTSYFPNLKKAILLLEDDYETKAHNFAAKFESIIQQPGAKKLEGLLIGRFQPSSEITREFLQELIDQNQLLEDIPVMANIDFGHTKPQVTLPIGGIAQLTVLKDRQAIKVIEH